MTDHQTVIAHCERAATALKAARRELRAAWGDGPDNVRDAEMIHAAEDAVHRALNVLP